MAQLNVTLGGAKGLEKLVGALTEKNRKEIAESCKLDKFAKVFEDGELVGACYALFENDLNVTRAAGALYMHRNTLTYKLRKLQENTGLDICTFDGAVAFVLMRSLYVAGKADRKTGKVYR